MLIRLHCMVYSPVTCSDTIIFNYLFVLPGHAQKFIFPTIDNFTERVIKFLTQYMYTNVETIIIIIIGFNIILKKSIQGH